MVELFLLFAICMCVVIAGFLNLRTARPPLVATLLLTGINVAAVGTAILLSAMGLGLPMMVLGYVITFAVLLLIIRFLL